MNRQSHVELNFPSFTDTAEDSLISFLVGAAVLQWTNMNKPRREQSKFPEAIEVIKACAERLQDLGALGTPTRTDARDTWGIVRIKNNKNECWTTKYVGLPSRKQGKICKILLVDQGISRAYCARITLWPSWPSLCCCELRESARIKVTWTRRRRCCSVVIETVESSWVNSTRWRWALAKHDVILYEPVRWGFQA